MNQDKTAILIQARLSSSRFPGKMMQELGGIPLFEYVYRRCLQSQKSDLVAIVTSDEKSDDPLCQRCDEVGIPYYRGSLENVLERYVNAARLYQADVVVRVCGDSPFVDVEAIDGMLSKAEEYNYMATRGGLDGFMSEVIRSELLISLDDSDKPNHSDREHVTKYIRDNIVNYQHAFYDLPDASALKEYKLTIDYADDLVLVNQIIESGLSGFDFTSAQVLEHLRKVKGIS